MSDMGTLVHWNDARGFGFIEARDGRRFFVHATSIARMVNRPRIGDAVSFVPQQGKDGRPEARSVMVAGANPVGLSRRSRGAPTLEIRMDWRLPAAGVLAILAGLIAVNDPSLIYLPLVYLVMGTMSFALYRADKSFAENGQWRVSEAMLLGVDFLGGIIGGLVAQAAFRHKTRKPGYVAAAVLFTGVHLAWLAGLASGLITVDEIMELPGLLAGI